MKLSSYTYNFIAVALAAASAFASCVQMEDPQDDAVGYLCFPGVEVDVAVEDILQTKALNVDVPRPNESAIEYVITDNNGEPTEKTGPWEPMKMPVGSYSISAASGTNGFGAPYFTGSYSGTIAALAQETPELKMVLSNSLVNLSVASALDGHFNLESVKLESEAVEEPVTFAAASIPEWYFVPAGAVLKITFSGSSSTGSDAAFVHSFTPSAKVAYKVICGKSENNLPTITLPDQQSGAWATRLYIDPATVSGSISDDNRAKLVYEVIPEGGDWSGAVAAEQISGDYYVVKGLTNGAGYKVRARIGNLVSDVKSVTVMENLEGVGVESEHYEDAGGNLAGTNSTLSVSLPGIIGTLNAAGLLELTGYSLSNGTSEVRTATAPGLMIQSSGWPYLPQGSNYILTIHHKLSNESATVSSTNTGFTSPSPKSFMSISLTSYSSYDKYLENNKDAANAMDAFTIKTLGATWTVSSDLMNNSNYRKSFAYNNNGQSSDVYSGNTCSLGDKTGLAVGTQYNVSASLTFDGETVSASKTHYITGLPFIGDLSNTNKESNWDELAERNSVIGWGNSSVSLRPNYTWGQATAKITSKQQFILPGNVNVNFINVVNRNGSTLANFKYYLKFGSTTIIDTTSSKNYDDEQSISAGTYKVEMSATYRTANLTESYTVNSIVVQYGILSN